jgi:hypothetical protein
MTQPAKLPLTYTDLVCLDDIDPSASETTSDLQNLLQDIYHVLIELPGSNPDDPTRGVGIDQYLSGTLTQLQTLPGVIDEQLTADPRITGCASSVQQTSGPFAFTITINVEVSGSVIGLQYGWSAPGGLQQVSVTP